MIRTNRTQANDSIYVQAAEKLLALVIANYALNSEYSKKSLEDGTVTARLDIGQKWIKLVFNGSVHCFVDANTGDVYKAASFKAPAKGIRYNLFTDMKQLEELSKNRNSGMWSTGYLYKR